MNDLQTSPPQGQETSARAKLETCTLSSSDWTTCTEMTTAREANLTMRGARGLECVRDRVHARVRECVRGRVHAMMMFMFMLVFVNAALCV
jgi:hypothetical protein